MEVVNLICMAPNETALTKMSISNVHFELSHVAWCRQDAPIWKLSDNFTVAKRTPRRKYCSKDQT